MSAESTGILLLMTMLALPTSLLASYLILRFYRRALLRQMDVSACQDHAGTTRHQVTTVTRSLAASPIDLELLDAESALTAAPVARERYCRLRRQVRNTAAVYLLGGGVFALIVNLLWFQFEHETGQTSTLTMAYVLCWPLVPTLMLVGVGGRLSQLLSVAGYFLGLVLVSDWTAQQGPWQGLYLWLHFMGIPTLMIFGASSRRIRGIGPTMMAGAAMVIALIIIGGDHGIARLFFDGQSFTMADVRQQLFPLLGAYLAIALLALGLGVVLFAAVAYSYRTKKTGNQQILLDSWWLTFCVWLVLHFSATAGVQALLVLMAFFGYKFVTVAGFRLLAARAGAAEPYSLLLLRVFGYRKRGFLHQLGHKWQHIGPINVIAAPDLNGGYFGPVEFYDFVRGRLSSMFITSPGDVNRSVYSLDKSPNPDGRYRVNKLYCQLDTWQLAVKSLMKASDVALMDLRGFSRQNLGCAFELRQLLEVVPIERIVLLFNEQTDRSLVLEMLSQTWACLSPESPNFRVASARISAFEVRLQGPRDVHALLSILCGAQAAQSVVELEPLAAR